MTTTKNILLIGRTGSGKSALANILINKEENFEEDGKFEEVFKESGSSFSETRDVKIKEFEANGVDYSIIDTVGICNTFNLTEEEIVLEITKACCNFKDGLNQILFVIGGRFAREEIKVYNIIRKRIFDEDIAKYTTIVRTKFPGFRNWEQCKKDIEKLKKEHKRSNKKIRKMVDSCGKIIYIDNLPLSSVNDKEINVYKKRKKDSRDIVLKHLATCQEVHKPKNLDLINKAFEDYTSEDKRSNNMQPLNKDIERLKGKNFIQKKVKQLTKKNPETPEEMKESLLEAAIGIRDNCKQM